VTDGATARVERVLPVAPPAAYAAWVDPATLARFIAPHPGSAEVEIDPRVGGGVRIVMTYPDGRREFEGEYLVLEPPDRLSFTWRPVGGDYESIVTVTFEQHGADETLMTITHSRLPSASVDDYLGGWVRIQDQLAAMLTR
jgi:uncharacterized protein YndB with AHSA1/START domain